MTAPDGGRPGDEAVEAAAEAIRRVVNSYCPQWDRRIDWTRPDYLEQSRIDAAFVLDRVRSRPVSGTEPLSPFMLRAADRLYSECERAVREGRIDARSPIGDATLDYREIREEGGPPVAADDPGEEVCRRCGGPNRPWAAPSPLWNAVMRGGSIDGRDEFDGIVCPTCFVVLAEERGIACGWWVEADTVTAELETVTPSGRTWDPVARRWVDAADGTQDKDHKPDMCPGCGCRRCICDYLAVPSPVSGTEWTDCSSCGRPLYGDAGKALYGPVSGTEPDTAKLVEAIIRELESEGQRNSDAHMYVAANVVRQRFLAGFSVDAGKPKEER